MNVKKWSLKKWTVVAGFLGLAVGLLIFKTEVTKAIVVGLATFFVVGVIIEIVVKTRKRRRLKRETLANGGVPPVQEAKPLGKAVKLESETAPGEWTPRS